MYKRTSKFSQTPSHTRAMRGERALGRCSPTFVSLVSRSRVQSPKSVLADLGDEAIAATFLQAFSKECRDPYFPSGLYDALSAKSKASSSKIRLSTSERALARSWLEGAIIRELQPTDDC